MNEDLENRLKNSDAFSSLVMESKIHKLVANAGWDCIRSPYYKDVVTGKDKEIDLIGIQRHEIKNETGVTFSTELALLIECKSLSGYHIIADGEFYVYGWESEMLQQVWCGFEAESRSSRISVILDKSLLTEQGKTKMLDFLKPLFYPDDNALYRGLVPDPLPVMRFPAFRETNIGSSKELENSVLWKSFMALNAAGESFSQFHWDRVEDEFLTYCQMEQNSPYFLEYLPRSYQFRTMAHHIGIHKILVIDADMWKANDPIQPLPYFRFLQRNVYGILKQWIDVVNMRCFEEYINKLGTYYSTFYRRTQLQRTR
jgi:hypothetical protein